LLVDLSLLLWVLVDLSVVPGKLLALFVCELRLWAPLAGAERALVSGLVV
jgi:hypothetical protein